MSDLQTIQSELSHLIVSIANLTHIKPEEINPEQSLLREGLGLDSIDLLEIVVNLEKKYGFKLRNDEQGQKALSNLRSLAEFTHRHVQGASSIE